MATPEIAWHFTLSRAMADISRDMEVAPSSIGLATGELPVLWFSNLPYDHSACGLVMSLPDGRYMRPNGPEEARLVGRGLFRVGVPSNTLLRFNEVVVRAGWGEGRVRALEVAAARAGVSSANWLGSLEPVGLRGPGVRFDYFDGSDWVTAPMSRAMAVVMEQHAVTEVALRRHLAAKPANGHGKEG